jgi:hypothetical protein
MLTNLSTENGKVQTAEGWVGVEAKNNFFSFSARKGISLRCVVFHQNTLRLALSPSDLRKNNTFLTNFFIFTQKCRLSKRGKIPAQEKKVAKWIKLIFILFKI